MLLMTVAQAARRSGSPREATRYHPSGRDPHNGRTPLNEPSRKREPQRTARRSPTQPKRCEDPPKDRRRSSPTRRDQAKSQPTGRTSSHSSSTKKMQSAYSEKVMKSYPHFAAFANPGADNGFSLVPCKRSDTKSTASGDSISVKYPQETFYKHLPTTIPQIQFFVKGWSNMASFEVTLTEEQAFQWETRMSSGRYGRPPFLRKGDRITVKAYIQVVTFQERCSENHLLTKITPVSADRKCNICKYRTSMYECQRSNKVCKAKDYNICEHCLKYVPYWAIHPESVIIHRHHCSPTSKECQCPKHDKSSKMYLPLVRVFGFLAAKDKNDHCLLDPRGDSSWMLEKVESELSADDEWRKRRNEWIVLRHRWNYKGNFKNHNGEYERRPDTPLEQLVKGHGHGRSQKFAGRKWHIRQITMPCKLADSRALRVNLTASYFFSPDMKTMKLIQKIQEEKASAKKTLKQDIRRARSRGRKVANIFRKVSGVPKKKAPPLPRHLQSPKRKSKFGTVGDWMNGFSLKALSSLFRCSSPSPESRSKHRGRRSRPVACTTQRRSPRHQHARGSGHPARRHHRHEKNSPAVLDEIRPKGATRVPVRPDLNKNSKSRGSTPPPVRQSRQSAQVRGPTPARRSGTNPKAQEMMDYLDEVESQGAPTHARKSHQPPKVRAPTATRWSTPPNRQDKNANLQNLLRNPFAVRSGRRLAERLHRKEKDL